jgi:hypothetical protein
MSDSTTHNREKKGGDEPFTDDEVLQRRWEVEAAALVGLVLKRGEIECEGERGRTRVSPG